MITITQDVRNEAMDFADGDVDTYNDVMAMLYMLEWNNGDEFLEDLLYGSQSKPIAWIVNEYNCS